MKILLTILMLSFAFQGFSQGRYTMFYIEIPAELADGENTAVEDSDAAEENYGNAGDEEDVEYDAGDEGDEVENYGEYGEEEAKDEANDEVTASNSVRKREIHVDLEIIDNMSGDTLHPDVLQEVNGKCSCTIDGVKYEKKITNMHLEAPCLGLYNRLGKGEKLEISMVHFTYGGLRTYSRPFTLVKSHD